MDNRPDERFELYDRFVADLKGGRRSDMFYDESDLVEIYDYASDNEDEYVKLEALLCGARLYPDSQALEVRRAYYYYHNSDTDAAVKMFERVNACGDPNTALWEIMGLKLAKELASEEVKSAIETVIMPMQRKFDDEDVIQFVAMIDEKGLLEWASSRRAAIAEKCEYPATFYYELGMLYDSASDNTTAASLFEEATMIEPFNTMFWECLARTCYNCNDWERALNAADYALAIDDTLSKVSFIRLASMARLGQELPNVTTRLEDLFHRLKDSPEEQSEVAGALMYCYETLGKRSDSETLALKMHMSRPEERIWVDYLLIFAGSKFDPVILDRYYKAIGGNCETDWLNWAIYCVNVNRLENAVVILEALRRHDELHDGFTLLYETMYRLGEYDRIADDFLNRENNARLPAHYWWRPSTVLVAILSMIHADKVEEGIAFARDVLAVEMPGQMRFDEQIAWHGTFRAIRDIIAAHEASEPIPVSGLDPFISTESGLTR